MVLQSQPGGEITTARFARYDDDQWHVITASLVSDNIRLEIDDYETFRSAGSRSHRSGQPGHGVTI